MKILESAENYLETIYLLQKQMGEVRAIDIARHLGFSKPSVSTALKSLRENDLVTVSDSGFLALTDAGLTLALAIYDRHETLRRFFCSIGVDAQTAHEDACKIEHNLSPQTFEKLKSFIAKQEI